MTFRRSPGALHSVHLFFGVDVVVYCEGGRSLPLVDSIGATSSEITLDTIYWRSVVSSYGLPKTFHFKSIGGKENIRQICLDVDRLNLNNITVCKDSDYDHFVHADRPPRRVARTFGYSWENDVVKLPVLESLITSVIGVGPDGEAVIQELRTKILQMEIDLRRWAEVDISLCMRGRAGIFDRVTPLATIDMSAPPTIRVDALADRLKSAGYRRKPRKIVSVAAADVTNICFGKLISRALYHTCSYFFKKTTNTRMEYELFMRLSINETMKSVKLGLLPEFRSHIESQQSAFS